jgi:hypothetical protein
MYPLRRLLRRCTANSDGGGARDDGRNEGDGSTGMEGDKGGTSGDACGAEVVVGVDGKGGDGGAVKDGRGCRREGRGGGLFLPAAPPRIALRLFKSFFQTESRVALVVALQV